MLPQHIQALLGNGNSSAVEGEKKVYINLYPDFKKSVDDLSRIPCLSLREILIFPWEICPKEQSTTVGRWCGQLNGPTTMRLQEYHISDLPSTMVVGSKYSMIPTIMKF